MRIKVLVMLLSLCPVGRAAAHDTGFGHSRRTMFFSSTEDALVLEYRITQNSDEALIETIRIDTDGDGELTKTEKDRYFAELGHLLASQLHWQTDAGEKLRTSYEGYRLNESLTQTFEFRVKTGASLVLLDDANFPHKPGQVRIATTKQLKVEPTTAVDLSHVDALKLTITRTSRPK